VQQGKATAKATLDSVRKYAQVFQSFDDPKDGASESLFLQRLKTMEHLTAYPFLMDLFVRFGDQKNEIDAVLTELESFLVRRMVCNLNSRGYNRLFLDLAKQLGNAPGNPATTVRQFLLSSEAESSRWPRDDEFKIAWLDIPVFRALRRQRTRMILEAIEAQLNSPKTEKIEIKEKLQIEHLLPRSWEKHWPLTAGQDDKEAKSRRARLLHTFGNLTLLNKKLNPALSNGPWEKKRAQILEHSKLNLNKFKDYPEWDEVQILKRGESLFELAKKIWPRPAS
jgi:hypothetical protein